MVRVKCYYIRGTMKSHHGTLMTESEVIEAKRKGVAKSEFRERHPGFNIVQANEREC